MRKRNKNVNLKHDLSTMRKYGHARSYSIIYSGVGVVCSTIVCLGCCMIILYEGSVPREANTKTKIFSYDVFVLL
jgi:hypothetical protein